MKELLIALYDYGVWANERLLAQAESLSDADLRRPFWHGTRSLFDDFAHLCGVDYAWFTGIRGALPPPGFREELAALQTIDAIRQKWAPLIAERRAFIAGISEEQLRQPIPVKRRAADSDLLIWQGLLQCANHGTQHRSEIAAMLSELRHSPGDLDFVYFCLEQAKSQ